MSRRGLENLDSEKFDEILDEIEVGEEDYVPPEYQIATKQFKKYCSCADLVPCNFCRWLFRVRNCKTHGEATRIPFKSCFCKKQLDDDFDYNKHVGIERDENREIIIGGPASSYQEHEPLQQACRCYRKKSKRRENTFVDSIASKPNVVDELVDPEEEESHEELTDVSCTCSESSSSLSGSSTEMETSTSRESWELSTDSYEDFIIGEGQDVVGSSSDSTPSEDSSVEGRDMNLSRVKWIKSRGSLREPVVEPDEVDLLAAQWGIKNLFKRKALTKSPKNAVVRDQKEKCYYQYWLVQKSVEKDYFLKTCRKS